MKYIIPILISIIVSACSNNIPTQPDIDGLERDVNNGGFNQYFFNASGKNCYATLDQLKKSGKLKTADLLETAINTVNTDKLTKKELIIVIVNRELKSLDNNEVIAILDSLDQMFFKYPDGSLKE
jgi:hypothetical protein